MTSLINTPTPADQATPGEATWSYAHAVTIAVEPITDDMRRDPFWTIPRLATWAIIARDQYNHTHLLATNADPIGNVVAFARTVAVAQRATFVEPAAECEYCGLPVAAGLRWCPPVPHGRDCESSDRGRELRYAAPTGPLALTGGWAA